LNFFITNIRTSNYLNQLTTSLIFKLLAALSFFILIPVLIDYLGREKYGVWSTLLSISSWVVIFDFGIGNGLRNKVSESIAKNKWRKAQEFVSTSYCIIGVVMFFLLIISTQLSSYVPWERVFNTSLISSGDIRLIVNITLIFVLTNFFLSLMNQVAHGVQKTSVVVMNQFFSNVISLISIYILSKYTDSSIFLISVVYGSSILSSNILVTAFFYHKHRKLIPKLSMFKTTRIQPLFSLGLKFFVLQVAVIILFSTDKLIITQFLGPSYVVNYDIVFTLFSVVTVFHGVIVTPLWSAYSNAFHKDDYYWMRNMMKNQIRFFGFLILFTLGLTLITPLIIRNWIGADFAVNWKLIVVAAFFVLILSWNNIFALFLNGINQFKLQLRSSIVAMLINIPLSIIFIRYFNMEGEGVLLATIISLGIFAVLGPIQVKRLLSEGCS